MTLWKHSNVGRVVQIIGNVVDVEFASGQLPAIYNALRVEDEGELSTSKIDVTVEVQQHLGENRVRAVAMQPTDGLVRGMTAIDTGQPIAVPVGRETLGSRAQRPRRARRQTRRGQDRQDPPHPPRSPPVQHDAVRRTQRDAGIPNRLEVAAKICQPLGVEELEGEHVRGGLMHEIPNGRLPVGSSHAAFTAALRAGSSSEASRAGD